MSTKSERQIRVSTKYLPVIAPFIAKLAPFIAKLDIRSYLTGVLIEPHPDSGVLLAASNGHVLAVIHDTEGYANTSSICQVSAPSLRACKAKTSSTHKAQWVHWVGNDMHITARPIENSDDAKIIGKHHFHTEFSEPIDGEFPDYRKILARMNSEIEPGLPAINTNLLKKFSEAEKLANTKAALFSRGANNAIIVRFCGLPEFLGAVMPMRHDEMDLIPSWLELPAEQEDAA